jgi:GNAT superfamily N-acetyltransferase
MDIVFRKAVPDDIDVIEGIYDRSHDAEEAGLTTTGWIRGIYPVRAVAEAALGRDDMYVAEHDGSIVAAGVINQIQVDVYADCCWKYEAADRDVSVLHTLVVDPAARGCGAGTAFVRFWEELAEEQGCTVLRLDTNARNTVARKLYAKLGYIESGIVPTVFNGLPDVDLVMMEKPLRQC